MRRNGYNGPFGLFIVCALLIMPVFSFAATVHLGPGSVTTSNTSAWGQTAITYPIVFNPTTGVTKVTLVGVNMVAINYTGPWGWPPAANDFGAQAQLYLSFSDGTWLRNSCHSAANAGGTWDAQAITVGHDQGFRKYLFQNIHSFSSWGSVLSHQYNVEAWQGPRINPGNNLPPNMGTPDPNSDKFDMELTVTNTGAGNYTAVARARMHYAASWVEMALPKPPWGPWQWQWNTAINNSATPDAAWRNYPGTSFAMTGFTGNLQIQMAIQNWAVNQPQNWTITWDDIIVDGTLASLPTVVWVDDDWTGPSNCGGHFWGYDAFNTINGGLAAVAAGGTINVAGGVYTEAMVVNKTVSFIGDIATSVVQGPGSGNGFLIQAPDVVIDGFIIRQFAIGIRSFGGPANYNNLTLHNLNVNNNTTVGLQLVFDKFNVVDIDNCQFSVTTAGSGISVANSTNIFHLSINNTRVQLNRDHGFFVNNGTTAAIFSINITNSHFDQSTNWEGIFIRQAVIGQFNMTGGSLNGNKGSGFTLAQAPSQFGSLSLQSVAVDNNGNSGIMLGGGSSTYTLFIQDCSFTNNAWEHLDLSGGWFGAFSSMLGTQIIGNTFYGTPWTAVYVGNQGVFGVPPIFRDNNFMAPGFGIFNANAATMDAEYNYWNSADGPNDPNGTVEVALGDPDPGTPALLNAAPAGFLGCNVTDLTVDYYPWLASPVQLVPGSVVVAATGGAGSFNVQAPTGYAWTAVSNDSWITVTGGSPGTGNGTVNYLVAWNPSALPRTGTITVNSKVFTINQLGLTAGSTAMFWATPTMVWPYGVVQFEDVSGLGATAWQWDFGDGQTSTLQNPLIMYTRPGMYSVKLTITTPTGPYTYTKKKLITVYGNGPKCHSTLELVDASMSHQKEEWQNAIDEDISGWDGTASVKGEPPYAIFKFMDGTDKTIDRVRLLTDTDMNYMDRWVFEFHVQVSTTGTTDGDFVTVYSGHKKHGNWEEFGFAPVLARYVKLVIDTPTHGWRQVGEFQVCPIRRYADMNQTNIDVTSPHLANGVDASQITIAAKDAGGVAIDGLTADDFHFIVYPGPVNLTPVTETSPGVYTMQMTSTCMGTQKMTTYINGIKVGDDTIVFNPASLHSASLVLVSHSDAYKGESWENAIDGDTDGWDGTVTAGTETPWAIFAFSDGTTKMVQHLKLLTDTNVGFDQRWVRAFHVMVSTTGTEDADFTTVYTGRQRFGYWQTHMFAATAAKYVKFVVDEPSHGWRQVGEIELMVADIPGAQLASQETGIAVVHEFSVRNYPNPFNPETTIEVSLPEASHVKAGVYNLLGQLVRTLADHGLNAGSHRMHWNGRNENGEQVPCGIYYLRVQTQEQVKVHQMLLLK